MSERSYRGPPIDITHVPGEQLFKDRPYASNGTDADDENDSNDPETDVIYATPKIPDGETTCDWWPSAIDADPEDLNADQREVIKTAVFSPDVSTLTEINRRADYGQKRSRAYAGSVLSRYWPEKNDEIVGRKSTANSSTYTTSGTGTDTDSDPGTTAPPASPEVVRRWTAEAFPFDLNALPKCSDTLPVGYRYEATFSEGRATVALIETPEARP